MFLAKVFPNDKKQTISFDEYANFNKVVSSEMFFSLMSVLHDRLPCAPNFFRLKRIFRTKFALGVNTTRRGSESPSRTIASPTFLKLSGFRKNK